MPRAPAKSGSVVPSLAGRDLRQAVLAVLRSDRKPWSGARIAAQVQEADPRATRDEVYDTLYRHADLFRKSSHGWELVAR